MGERTAAEQARHTDELAQLHQQVQLFVEHFTAQVQSSLAVVHLPATSTSSSSSSHPTVVSLDGILPPPPQPKSKRKASSAAPSTTTSSLSSLPPSSPSVDAECDNSDEGEEVERDAFGRSIKRRRSKLPLKAVLVLRAWFSQHLTFPYPSEQEKEQLATAAHLQPRQVQNWLTNTRKRFWAPWVKARSAVSAAMGSSAGTGDKGGRQEVEGVNFTGFSLEGS